MYYEFKELPEGYSHAHNFKDQTGKVFGKCTVIKLVGHDCYNGVRKKPVYECLCHCGELFLVRGNDLVTKRQISCGRHNFFTAEYNKKTKNKVFWDTKSAVLSSYKRGALDRGLEFSISKERFFSLVKQDCFYCGASPSMVRKPRLATKTSSFIHNGIDRLDNSLGYIEGNVVPCCKNCNKMKHTYSLLEWIEQIDKILKWSKNNREFRDLLDALKSL